MRGSTSRQVTVPGSIDPGELIPTNHPIRKIRPLAEVALKGLEPTFERMYPQMGRPSVPPEHLLTSSPLMALYSIRSEPQVFEALARHAPRRHLLSSSQFTVAGTLLEAWASMKSLPPGDQDDDPGDGNGYTPGNPDVVPAQVSWTTGVRQS